MEAYKIEESYWKQKLATGLHVKESDIDEELNKIKLENLKKQQNQN